MLESPWALYNCTMSLLLSIAKIKGGAKELLKYGVVKSMTQNRLFQEGAAAATPVGVGGLPTQRQRVLPALRLLLCMASELPKNREYTEQLVQLLATHFQLFEPVLASIVTQSFPEGFTLQDMEQAQNIAALLAHVARNPSAWIAERQLLQYQDYMLRLLQCFGHAGFANLGAPGTFDSWWYRLRHQETDPQVVQLSEEMKPAWVITPGSWTTFDNLKVDAAISLMVEVSTFCRIRAPGPSEGGALCHSAITPPLDQQLFGF